jgi:putative NIF3 family GTP cyclohydrolase 1 type 2
MVKRKELVSYIEQLFADVNFPDYSYNGLQFEGREEVKKIVAGVDATVEFFQKAQKNKADFALVHHGLFWKGAEWTRLDRINQRIFKALADAQLNLYALHLPLDAHPVYGNNAQIAEKIGAEIIGPFGGTRNPIGILAGLKKAVAGVTLPTLLSMKARSTLSLPVKLFIRVWPPAAIVKFT